MSSSLTSKQKTFVDSIILGNNGTKAAMDAYDTYDLNTAAVIAHENLRKPKIMTEINMILENRSLIMESVSVLADSMVAVKYSRQLDDYIPDHAVRLVAATAAINLYFVVNGHHKPL